MRENEYHRIIDGGRCQKEVLKRGIQTDQKRGGCSLPASGVSKGLAAIFGLNSALGSAIGTMFLSFGNAFMFGGLLAALPDQEAFDRFREMYRTGPITAAVAGKSI